MAAGRMRSTRRLRSWIVEQVSSGKYPGLVWDDEAKTMFRIPWKHAGKQDFRKDEDAAIFKAWAEFKGKLTDGVQDNPASWKTRLRCALNKSPEFCEVMERAQLDISEPYKVYRLVPISEQGVLPPEKKPRVRGNRKSKRRRSSSESDSEDEVVLQKHIKTEEVTSQLCVDEAQQQDQVLVPVEEPEPFTSTLQKDVDEITLDLRIEENVPSPREGEDSFVVAVQYLGQEVLRRSVAGSDIKIAYLAPSPLPPTPALLKAGFPRILLPEPPAALPAGPQRHAMLTLLPFMERGVALTCTPQGVYGKRFCQGRVYWTGPHTRAPGPHKMERSPEPVLLFSKDAFKQQLDQFRSSGGEPPRCGITLCFGEELSAEEDLSKKLITVQISFPWAERQVERQAASAPLASPLISLLQTLSESPLSEITLNLVTVPPDGLACASV